MQDLTSIDRAPTGFVGSSSETESFHREGFALLRGFLDVAALSEAGRDAMRTTIRYNGLGPPHAEPGTALSQTLQIRNSWQLSQPLRGIVCNLALAEAAARVLGAAAVQLYSDLVVVKEPSAEAADWHVDAARAVVDGEALAIAYIPLHPAGPGRGGLELRPRSHQQPFARQYKPTSSTRVRQVGRELEHSGCPVLSPEFEVGDVAFYSGLTFHRLAANLSTHPVASLWVLYLPHGESMIRPSNAAQSLERTRHFTDVQVGRPITTSLNPLLWQAACKSAGTRHELPDEPPR